MSGNQHDDREPDGENVRAHEFARAGHLAMDELFSVLSRPGNRYVLTYLLLEEGPVSLVELVEYVVDVTEPPAGMQRAEFSGQLLNRFIETILPELDERGLLEYDRDAQMVAETDATSLTLPYLRAGLEQGSQRADERTT